MSLLNDNISFLIDKNRFNQDEIADLLLVSRGMISSWIRGKASPKYDKLLLISEKFNISCDDLLKKDLSKLSGSVGLLGASKNRVVLPLPTQSVQEETESIYKTLPKGLKKHFLTLLQKDKEVAAAIKKIIKESIN